MLRLLLAAFLSFAVSLRAQYAVRVVTISAPELPGVRGAMLTPPAKDGGLREELHTYFQEPVSDTLVRCGPGKASVEALTEVPYATEFGKDEFRSQITPRGVSYKNTGVSVTVEIPPAAADQPLTMAVTWDRVSLAGHFAFPVLSMPSARSIEQPRFVTDHIFGRLPVVPGQWRLLGITRPVETEPRAPAVQPQVLFTFVQVSAAPADTVKPGIKSPPENRYHLVSFRIPAAEGMDLSTRPRGGDARLLDGFLERAEFGKIRLDGHAACVVRFSKPVNHLERPKGSDGGSDPFPGSDHLFPGGEYAGAESILEFPYATSFEPDPEAFSAKNTGHTFHCDEKYLDWNAVHYPVKMVPATPQAEAAAISFPEFVTDHVRLYASLAPGDARLAGTMLLPEDGGPRMMQVCFLKNAGRAPADAPPAAGLSELYFAGFSLTPEDAASLAAMKADEQWAALRALTDSGQSRVPGWQSATGTPGTSSISGYQIEAPSADGCKVSRYGSLLSPLKTHVYTLGNQLGVTIPSARYPLNGELSFDLDLPPVLPLAAFQSAADADTALPSWEPVKISLSPLKENNPALSPGVPRLRFPAALKLAPGHPEYGRRHVMMLLLRE